MLYEYYKTNVVLAGVFANSKIIQYIAKLRSLSLRQNQLNSLNVNSSKMQSRRIQIIA